jgi:hypothetical protein
LGTEEATREEPERNKTVEVGEKSFSASKQERKVQ